VLHNEDYEAAKVEGSFHLRLQGERLPFSMTGDAVWPFAYTPDSPGGRGIHKTPLRVFRSLAADLKHYAFGDRLTPLWGEMELPAAYVVDVGADIEGPDRLDVFVGDGEDYRVTDGFYPDRVLRPEEYRLDRWVQPFDRGPLSLWRHRGLQMALNALMGCSLKLDGIAGPKTRAALGEYQRSRLGLDSAEPRPDDLHLEFQRWPSLETGWFMASQLLGRPHVGIA
jgi:hypothetical protein